MDKPSFLKLKNGGRLAYRKTEGAGPGIVFMGGFRSDMTGVKAVALENFARERGLAFVRFDYRGHGESSDKFEDCTLGDWKDDALEVLTRLTKGPQVIVGSSMGGWLALLAAWDKPRRVAGLITIAAAPDFTENLIWDKLTKAQQKEIMTKGRIMVPSEFSQPYPITKKFIEDARDYLILPSNIPVYCPVRLIHGMKDKDVPWEVSMAVNEKLASQDVKTILVEHGDHRLSEPKDIERLLRVTSKLLESIKTI